MLPVHVKRLKVYKETLQIRCQRESYLIEMNVEQAMTFDVTAFL